MHRAIIKIAVAALALFTVIPSLFAADPAEKREMRSAWVATVWRIDWPPAVITETGNTKQIDRQKESMTKMLDSLAINNFNAINFQVRSRCDAMYKSSYEPWSTDLVAERGMEPGWDPLEWIVDECHKRGMECHAWINPYRYTTSVSASPFNGPDDYATVHPEWLLTHNNAQILNPALPEVRQRICDVAAEIVRNYDVDGLLFDDYFYLSGTPTSADAEQYNAYKAGGGSLGVYDWRRENVNQMVDDVYRTVKSVKPYCRFGISPAGVCCTSQSMANKYGVRVCPSGSDWQYGDIMSEPLAWMSRQSLDFISPQVYWTRGYSAADYSKIVPWWGEIAQKFGRHMYVSHSIDQLNGKSSAKQNGDSEAVDPDMLEASGPNNDSFEEFAEQIRLNRSSSLDGNFGSIFYSVKYIYSMSPRFGHYLLNSVFNTPALVPAMTWHAATDPGLVTNIVRDGSKLSWDGYDNVRYTVYAVPNSVPVENFQAEPEYLLGMTYVPSFTIPDNRLGSFNYAVCVLDRFGNEYSAAFQGRAVVDLAPADLTFPANGEDVEFPFSFTWQPVEGASQYVVEVSEDPDFSSILTSAVSTATTCHASALRTLDTGKPYYWRVIASGVSANSSTSEIKMFKINRIEITSPAEAATDVDINPTITWGGKLRETTIEIALDSDFQDIVVEGVSSNGSFKVPAHHLAGYTTYYARLIYQIDGETIISPTSFFTTREVIAKPTTIAYPADNGEFFAEDHIQATPADGYYQLTFQIDTKPEVGSRFIQETVKIPAWTTRSAAGEFSKTLEPGQTYYMRVRGTYHTAAGNKNTDWSPVVKAVYKGNVGVDAVDSDFIHGPVEYINIQGIPVESPAPGQIIIRRQGTQATKVLTK